MIINIIKVSNISLYVFTGEIEVKTGGKSFLLYVRENVAHFS